jgi:hypothetical protein
MAPAICVHAFVAEQKYKFWPAGALVLKYACPTEHVPGLTAPWAYATGVQVFAAVQVCNWRPVTPSLAKYNWPAAHVAGILAIVPTCTGVVVLPLKFTEDAMSTVGLPPDPVPLVTLMLEDPAVIVRFAVTPGDVSTIKPLAPGSLSPPPAQVSVPDEFSQQTPEPAFA